ncbi:hypothetical protein PR202_ga13828 [Eleusine coracana subsp. coracana]|uniref:FHA domain-containing protein n=1 Tax=Eleusine coracana subsp. coracana TaxID=191504 RepID=A0AAV5CFF7_ELECO|nr:hypothetical protein PR202_ga13828 [Eleusine coracana subsp. coracana]
MGALSASTSTVNWLVEDDILLKNAAVETGASLESLAKGAVCFSRKFTLQEIQDRWNSLLYDPEISTQASSRMAEYENELSTSDPAKAHKLFNTKAKDFAFQKRKIDSVKNLYYAMRKRICNDPCNTADLGFLVAPCSCIENGGECVCGGQPKLSQGNHIINNIEPGMSSVSCYGQASASYNGGHVYPGMNGHSFHTKPAESMTGNGDPTNIVPYGYSDFQHHVDSNECGNRVAQSKTLVIPNQVGGEHAHFDNNVQEHMPLQVTGQPESSQGPCGTIWSGVQARDTLTFSEDKKLKSEDRDPLTFRGSLAGGICTSDLEHSEMPETDFIDFPFFNNTDDFMLNVPVPDHQMQFNPHDNRQELGDVATLPNCMPSNALSDLGIEDHVATVPTPVQAEVCSDNENDIPNYYDLEALILDQDLIPWDQDTDFMHPEVTRFQHPESRKSLIRLEQGARSYLNRAIMSHGAFAVIYGLHLKYYIKDPEVILGRETEDVKVDIDLGKEGRANKISRRQAVIKMDEAGSFHIKNIGKCPIFVNSKEIPSCKRINLSSDSLIEIKDMRFIFHVNLDAVKQYLSHDLKPER